MLAETKTVDRLEILPDGIIQIRHRTVITDTDTGSVRASHFHRTVLRSGDDLTDLDPQTVQVIRAAWTPAVPPAQPEPTAP
jgi:hypothetical protein